LRRIERFTCVVRCDEVSETTTLKRILFRIWLVASLIWLASWGNVVGLDPDARVALSQPKVYVAIVTPPVMLGALCGWGVLAAGAFRRGLACARGPPGRGVPARRRERRIRGIPKPDNAPFLRRKRRRVVRN